MNHPPSLRKKISSYVALFAVILSQFSTLWTYQVWAVPYDVDGSFTQTTTQALNAWRAEQKASFAITIGTATDGILYGTHRFTLDGTMILFSPGWTNTVDSSTVSVLTTTNQAATAAAELVALAPNFTAASGINYTVTNVGAALLFQTTGAETRDGTTIPVTNYVINYHFGTNISTPGYSYQAPAQEIIDFTPEKPKEWEIFELTLGTNTYQATADADPTGEEIVDTLISEINTTPSSLGTCVDNIFKITCTSTDTTTSLNASTNVVYPAPDTTNPLVYFPFYGEEEITLEVGSTYTESWALWVDNRDGEGDILIPTSGTVDTNTVWDYILTYSYTDIAGNYGSADRIIHIVDTIAPILTLIGTGVTDQELDLPLTDSGATWTDNYDGTGTVYSSTVFTQTWAQTAEYSYTDTSGNIWSITRNVTVIDTIAPVVTIDTNPATINANSYLIEWDAPTAETIDVTWAFSGTLAVTPDVYGDFKILVPLMPDNPNTITITARDASGNIGTGSVIITEDSSQDAFSGAVEVGGVEDHSTISWTGITDTTKVTLETPVQILAKGGGSAVLASGTEITTTWGAPFDASGLETAGETVTSWLDAAQVSRWALRFGISNVPLFFSKPIKIEIPVTGYAGTTIPVKVKHGGSTAYNTIWLTNDPNSTCTNGVSSVPGNIAPISGGIATIYTCSASTFTTVETTSSGGGGGGGGGGGASSTVSTVINPVVTNFTIETTEDIIEQTQEEIEVDETTTDDEQMMQTMTDEDVIPENDEVLEIQETSEIPSNPISEAYIEKLIELWAVDTTIENFMPEKSITRAEFLKILFNVHGINYESTDVERDIFKDIDANNWTAKIAYTSLDKNISTGYDDSTFRPNAPISRIEAIKFILKMSWVEIPETTTTDFIDVYENWMKKYVNKARDLEIISGQESPEWLIFRPLDNLSRAEAAKIVVKTIGNSN